MLKLKRLFSLILTLIVFASFSPMHVLADADIGFASELLSEEIIYVADIPILFTNTVHNGILIESATIMEATSEGYFSLATDTATARAQIYDFPDDFSALVAEASDRRYFAALGVDVDALFEENANPSNAPLLIIGDRVFAQQRSATNPAVILEHSFQFDLWRRPWLLGYQATLSAWNGTIRVHNGTSGNAESMQLSQTVTRHGTSIVGVSFPWGIQFNNSANSEFWSHTERNTFMVTARWPRSFSSAWPLEFIWNRDLLTIHSRADVSTRHGGAIFVDSAVITNRINVW